MKTHGRDFELDRPGALIAALPAVLGFVPEKSLILVSVTGGELGSVMRVDLGDTLIARVDQLAEVAANTGTDAAIAVIVDADGALCPVCGEEYRALCAALAAALGRRDVVLWAAHLVDRVARGGRWRCVDGCEAAGVVDDPSASPLAAAAVLDGRRLYARRADLQAVVAVDEQRRAAVAAVIDEQATAWSAEHREDPDGRDRRDVNGLLAAANRVAAQQQLDTAEVAALGFPLTDVRVRDTLYALAVGESAAEAEALWGLLARSLPEPWRVEALVLLAFSAYARGDGPLAGVSLDAALSCRPDHRMAGMLDTALQSGMRPEQIRELAATGYRLAEQLGLRLPPRQRPGRRAG